MKNNKTIYIHIGMPKTGTTSIQHFLFVNQKMLEEVGLFYPIVEKYNKIEYANISNLKSIIFDNERFECSQDVLNFFKNKASDLSSWFENKFKENFFEQINKSKAEKIIFSEESLIDKLFGVSEFIKVLKNYNFDVKVIVYLRNPVDYLISHWGQDLKSAHMPKIGVEEYLTNNILRIKFFIENVLELIEINGTENVIVRPYEKEQWKNQNLIDDFMNIFGIEVDEKYIQSTLQNISFKRNTSEFLFILKKLNRLFNKQNLYNLLCDDINVIDTIPIEILENVYAQTECYYDKLAEIYGKDKFFTNNALNRVKPIKYDKFRLSIEQLNFLHEKLDENISEKEKLKKQVEEAQYENEKLKQKIIELERNNQNRPSLFNIFFKFKK